MPKESFDEAYQRGLKEGMGIQNPPSRPPQQNDSVRQAHQAGLADGAKAAQKK